VRYGKRAPEIVRHAAENEVDLIIISSHRADVTDSQHAWMTISHQIALLAQTSVLLVK
jgi:nucleotide-binding universal stress UspA family protein